MGKTKEKPRLYCKLCWQEFDFMDEHDRGSYLGGNYFPSSIPTEEGERLNGHCPGDIHRTDYRVQKRNKRLHSPNLDLDQGDPLRLR